MSITHDEFCWVSAWQDTQGEPAPWLTDRDTCRFCEDIEQIRDQVALAHAQALTGLCAEIEQLAYRLDRCMVQRDEARADLEEARAGIVGRAVP